MLHQAKTGVTYPVTRAIETEEACVGWVPKRGENRGYRSIRRDMTERSHSQTAGRVGDFRRILLSYPCNPSAVKDADVAAYCRREVGAGPGYQKPMHKVFISYHHAADQAHKDALVQAAAQYRLFVDGSVDTGDIDDDLEDESIRQVIRDDYLRDTTVTIVLVGPTTRARKHVDWEIYSSMYDGARNRKSGILAIMLPSSGSTYFTAAHEGEKDHVYSDVTQWITITERAEYERRYPGMPDRIIDNLLAPRAKVSVTTWDRVSSDFRRLAYLIDVAARDRAQCEYDLSRPLRRSNS